MAEEGLKPRHNHFGEDFMEGYISDDNEQSDATLSHEACPASTKSSTKPLTLTNKDRHDLQISEPSTSKQSKQSKQTKQTNVIQSHDPKPAAPTKHLFNQGRIQVTDPHLAGVLNDMISNPQEYKNTPMIDGIPASCFTPLYPSSDSSSNTKTENVSNRKKRKIITQDPLGTHKSFPSIDKDIKIDKSSTTSKDEKVETKGPEKIIPTPPTPAPRNKKGMGSRYAPATSTDETQTREFSVAGTMMDLPVLSMNAPGVENTKMCPPCARLKIGGHVCTGAIPICDQCLERNLDAEMCCSEELLFVIKRRRREGGGMDKKGGGSGSGGAFGAVDTVGGGKTVRLFGKKD